MAPSDALSDSAPSASRQSPLETPTSSTTVNTTNPTTTTTTTTGTTTTTTTTGTTTTTPPGSPSPPPGSPPNSPTTSPTAALESLDLDLDFSSLSTFDLAGSDWTQLLSSAFRAQRAKLESTTTVARSNVRAQLLAAQQKLVHTQLRVLSKHKTAEAVKNRDKAAFVIGVTNMWVTSLLLGMAPRSLPAFYLCKIVVLLTTRLVVYRRKRFHYFMFDMCYYVNALLVLLILFPGSHPNLFCATWGLANGPVLVAIAAWRNSLVFHSLDKITSLLIHFDPPLTLFAMRWVVVASSSGGSSSSASASALSQWVPEWAYPRHLLAFSEEMDVGFSQMVGISVAMYVFWQAVYWVFVWTMRADKIAAGYATSTTWMLSNPKSLMSRLARRVAPPQYRPAVFMLVQLLYTLLTVTVTYVFYKSRVAHGAALVVSLGFATWNGAGYYFDVFSRRYVGELEELERELAGLGKEAGGGGGGGGASASASSGGEKKVV
ncbi:hypothetical protein HDU87_002600 [Geranomyces variabilis]|uniref:Glycerophosphocholine acyltransferase 1 n=1 Tax=Geranomyces variabilis TaxID=109894 RepID=A0AAD5TRF2_9FUNG|nr:hypothetical protein HDU87_002600 [Geranomyces variabilis]